MSRHARFGYNAPFFSNDSIHLVEQAAHGARVHMTRWGDARYPCTGGIRPIVPQRDRYPA